MNWIDPSVLSPALCLDKHLQIKMEQFYDSNVGIKTSFFPNHNEHRALIVV